MKLVLCEKPSVGKSIAGVIGASGHREGYLEGNGYLVSWCIGHLVGLAPADRYDQRYLKWVKEDLPILPEPWQFVVFPDTKEQFQIVKGLMERPDVEEIIEATDAGREGELIFRLVYQMAGCRKPFQRLWISSMEESAVREGFRNLRPGAEYDHLFEAALCRAKADWLVGINATRFFTTLYRGKTLNVGRVMTPTLALLSEREKEIEGFKKEKFYKVELDLGSLKAFSGKIRSRTDAEKLRKSCLGKPAEIEKAERQEKREKPPKLFDLTSLQREANRVYGYRAQQTLDCLQLLYEKKLATYPRTDSRYLTEDMAAGVETLCTGLAGVFPFARDFPGKAAVGQVVNNAKVSDHHAILPTKEAVVNLEALPTGEKNILMLVTARLLCAVWPEDYVSETTAVLVSCNGAEFTAKGHAELSAGWKAMERAFAASLKKRPDAGSGGELPEEKEERLPPGLAEGLCFTAEEAALREGTTSPPVRYTEGSLLSAMERAVIVDLGFEAERKGLGTPATRAGIIEKLIKCGFIKREKAARGGPAGRLLPTPEGTALAEVLPEAVKSPKLTAEWENNLTLVAKGELPAGDFMAGIENMVRDLVSGSGGASAGQKKMFMWEQKTLGACPNCGGQVAGGKFGAYCQNKCGMSVGKIMGILLTEAQVKDVLAGRKILLRGLKGRDGKSYNAYAMPNGTEKYSYTKNGEKKEGVRFKVEMEFVK